MTTETYTTAQAAEKLGCTQRTVERMIERGTLKAAKLDPTAKSVYLIPRSEIERLLKGRAQAFGKPRR